MIRKIKTFIMMDLKTKGMVLKVYILTGIYRFQMLYIPFSKLAKKIGKQGLESSEVYNETLHDYIVKVRRVVMMTSKNTPWESLCLVQALTAQNLLNKRSISSTLYLGLGKDENKQPIAHAWIKHGGKVVVGEKGMERFSVVAKFACIHD